MRDSFHSRIDVYSSSTNSWRRKDKLVHVIIVDNSFSKGDLNGALHWWGAFRKNKVNLNIIISFNVRDEVRRYIKLPVRIELKRLGLVPFCKKCVGG